MTIVESWAAWIAGVVGLSWEKAAKDIPSCLLPLDDSRPSDCDNSIRVASEKQLVKQLAENNKSRDSNGLSNYLIVSKADCSAQPKVTDLSRPLTLRNCATVSVWAHT